MQKVALLLCGAVLLVATSAGHAGSWDAGAHVGYTMMGDVEDEDFVLGAQAVYDLSDRLTLEVAVSKFSDVTGEVEEGVVWGFDYDVTPITLTARMSWPRTERLDLYAGGGVGYYLVDASANVTIMPGSPTTAARADISSDNGYGIHGVAGLTSRPRENVELFAEIRYAIAVYSYDASYSGVYSGYSWSMQESEDEDYMHGMIRLGANIIF